MSGTLERMNALVALLVDAGVDEVIEGLPDTLDTQTVAYILTGPRVLSDAQSGLISREITFYVYLGYRVDGQERDAERNLATLVDEIEMKWLVARDVAPMMQRSVLGETMAGGPDYRDFTEQEYRWWPLSITTRETFNRP